MSNETERDYVMVGDTKVRPEGVSGNILTIHHIVGEDGLSYRERNLQLQHAIPLYTYVEYEEGRSGLSMRGFVAEHSRDCDGTPLYSISRRPEKDFGVSSTITVERILRQWHYGLSEESLTVIKSADEVLHAVHKVSGFVDKNGNWVD